MKGYSFREFLFYLTSPLLLLANPILAEERDALLGDWGGLKDKMEESGITTEAAVIGDVMGLVSGGLDKGTYSTFLYQLATEVDTEKAGLWSNGTFMVNLIGITGGTIYERVGDVQVSSNIDGMGVDTLSVYEAWYEHSFLDGDLSILTGIQEYNSEFYYLDYSSVLLNSSFGFGIDVSQRGNSIYPITALGSRIRVQPSENTYAQVAIYDGIPGNPNNLQGTHVILRQDDGLFYAAEVGATSTEEDAATGYYKIALGGWHHTTDFTDFAERERNNSSGGYLIGERKVYSEEDDSQGLGIFGQAGFAQSDRNAFGQYFGLGLHYTGLINGRNEDIATFGIAHARHGNAYMQSVPDADNAETSFELSYRAGLGHGIAIQPDIQYIVNPGTDSAVDNALVVGSRISVNF